ncbi:hypothetical protein [Aeoliella sp.]|uniref:hypothetical protein n=1 Tax=Aeoliella sp. TaxID=2795800 RepID=UPI003CCC116B
MGRVLTLLGRLKRCHLFTWLVVLLASVVMTLLIVPSGYERSLVAQFRTTKPNAGWWERQQQAVYDEAQAVITDHWNNPPEGKSRGRWVGVFPVLWQHGWPMPYLVRAQPAPIMGGYHNMRSEPLLVLGRRVEMCNGQPSRFVSWSNYDNWPLESAAWRVHPVGLVVDGAVWFSVVAGLGWLTQWWLGSRGGLLRFRLIDLLGALTAVAIGLAWWGYHTRVHRLEDRVNDHFVTQKNKKGLRSGSAYVGPDWIAKLVGDDAYAQHFSHVTWARYTFRISWREDIERIVELPYLKKLGLHGEVPFEAVGLLESLDRLDNMNLELTAPQQPKTVDHREELLRPEVLHELGRLRLRELRLVSPSILAEDIDRLLAASHLEKLTLSNISMTLTELDALKQRYPEVRFLVRWPVGDKEPPDDIEERIAEIKQERAEQ